MKFIYKSHRLARLPASRFEVEAKAKPRFKCQYHPQESNYSKRFYIVQCGLTFIPHLQYQNACSANKKLVEFVLKLALVGWNWFFIWHWKPGGTVKKDPVLYFNLPLTAETKQCNLSYHKMESKFQIWRNFFDDAGKSKKKVDDDIFLPALLLTAMASANTEHEPNHYVNVFISMMVAPVDNGVKQ